MTPKKEGSGFLLDTDFLIDLNRGKRNNLRAKAEKLLLKRKSNHAMIDKHSSHLFFLKHSSTGGVTINVVPKNYL